ncbi:MAG: GntR family transcriptional regulator, partial [Eubacteriales bacterium]|nr:GntR family transcriptional regulator [Eubacteriales bacterium]
MLTYILDPGGRTPLYEQLYRLIRRDIMSGALRGGERLPSARQLAAHLEISRITVDTAYSQLLAEGYVTSAPRRGYFVQEALAMPQRAAAAQPIQPPQPPKRQPYRFDFKTNIVDTDCFPFSTWAKLSRAVLTDYADRLLQESAPQGEAELREAIRDYLL